MSKHAQEPCGVFQYASGDVFVSYKEASFHICEIGSEDDDSVIPDARRIVACVNACAGVDPAWLETMAKVGGFAVMNQYIAAYNQAAAAIMAEKQRDELLAALEKCRKELSAWMRDHGDDIATQEAVADARAAIASVKGQI